MSAGLDIETVGPRALVEKVAQLRHEGYRLVQIGAARLPEHIELTYSFDRQGRLKDLRLQLPSAQAAVPSITSIYWAAFLYENELHDLFDVKVDGIAVDFHGTLYQTTIKFPFGSTRVPPAAPANPSVAQKSTSAVPPASNSVGRAEVPNSAGENAPKPTAGRPSHATDSN